MNAAMSALTDKGLRAYVGASWTTDAPFRETASAIASSRAWGVLAVEMEAAALYTFARKATKRFSVSRMLPIRWALLTEILRRAKGTAPSTL